MGSRWRSSCTFLLVLCTPAIALHAQFSVEQALAAPFSNQLTAAPAKARVAWFTDAEGHRNIWVAGSQEAARPVTHNTADDGQDMDDIAWSRDAERLGWTRGTGAAGGDHTLAANPAELPGRVQQHVEWVDVSGGPVHVGPEGHTPLFLPDGRHLLFLRRGTVWITGLNTPITTPQTQQDTQHPFEDAVTTRDAAAEDDRDRGATRTNAEAGGTRPLFTVRGSAYGLRLSPDGSQLAFVSERGDHSFVGVYTFATRTLTWMDPGTGLDHDPAWSPDGRQIAFLREVPIVSPIADRWMREGDPWSIRIADVATGSGKERWHADRGAGSLFHGVAAPDQLLWMRDGHLVFPWEKDGWTGLYFFAARSSDAPQALAAGAFEVDMVASDGQRIAYSANAPTGHAGDDDRRHVTLWNALPRPNARIAGVTTTGDGSQTNPAILTDGTLAYLGAPSPREPLTPFFQRDGNAVAVAPELIPSRFPAAQFVLPQQVIFPAADGASMHGQLFLPPHRSPGARLPAVVFFHGGSRRQMLLGFHPMEYYHQAYAFNQYLASRVFAVLSVNYRSGTGYGLNFRQALHYGANGASEDNDVVGAAKYLQSRSDIDPQRIGAWGGSYGGYLTALALARHSDLYRAGVDLHGVHDWSLELDLWKPTSEPGVDQAAIARRAFESSPMASLDTWKSPVLLMQGDDDRNVLFAQTVRLAAELRRRGVPVQEKVFPDEVHDFLLHRNWVTAYQATAEFLERNLMPR